MAEEEGSAIDALCIWHRISLTPSLLRQVFREQVAIFTTGELLSDLLLRYLRIYVSPLKRTLRMTSAHPNGNILRVLVWDYYPLPF